MCEHYAARNAELLGRSKSINVISGLAALTEDDMLWIKRANAPAICCFCEYFPLMQAEIALLPEFDALRNQPPTTPEWRSWHIGAFESRHII